MKKIMLALLWLFCAFTHESLAEEDLEVELKELKQENRTLRSSLRTVKKIEKLKDKNEVLALELKCTKSDDLKACNDIGVHYYQKKKRSKSIDFWNKACDGLIMESCYYLGRHYDGKKQSRLAVKFYSKACDGDSFVACNNLGAYYGRKKNYAFAKKYFKDACRNSYAGSCVNLAKLYEQQGNSVETYYWFQQACELDVKSACVTTQLILDKHRKACLKNIDQSCIALGNLYKRVENFPQAKDNYQLACKRGQVIGCFNLGLTVYELGEKQASINAWKQACELKDQYSCLLYLSYGKQLKLLSKYTDYYKRLCESGDGIHCYWLAVSHSVMNDVDKALDYLRKSTQLGFTDWVIPDKNTLLKTIRDRNDYKKLKLRTREKNA